MSNEISTPEFVTLALTGFDDNNRSAPESRLSWTTLSSNNFRHTDQVLVVFGSPITISVPDGLYILAPQILVSTVSYAPILSIADGFTIPAHWNGLPISACSSTRRTLNPFSVNFQARYPPTGPAPITITS